MFKLEHGEIKPWYIHEKKTYQDTLDKYFLQEGDQIGRTNT